MTQPPPADQPPHVESRARRIHWDALAAVIAALIGLLALGVSGYTAYVQRQQVRAQVWPYLFWASSDVSSQYLWVNKGVGPALVKSAQVLVDGKPQHNWNAVMQSLQVDPQGYRQSSFNGNVISAGETLPWIIFKNHADFQGFRDAAKRKHLEFKVCYCSTLGDCWELDSAANSGKARLAVGQCPLVPEAAQFHD